jgi:hypothetical protein
MTLEKRDDLLAISPGAMMLLLIANIRTSLVDSGNSDTECAVSFLP